MSTPRVRAVLGYHGTTTDAAERIVAGEIELSDSEALWLGKGIYFFQQNRALAESWAADISHRRGGTPALVEAQIDLTDCLDLLDSSWVNYLRWTYHQLRERGVSLPSQPPLTVMHQELKVRTWTGSGPWRDHGKNKRDYLVIEEVILALKKSGQNISSVRSVFLEGKTVYLNSWFFDKSHVSIAVRTPYDRIIRPMKLILVN